MNDAMDVCENDRIYMCAPSTGFDTNTSWEIQVHLPMWLEVTKDFMTMKTLTRQW